MGDAEVEGCTMEDQVKLMRRFRYRVVRIVGPSYQTILWCDTFGDAVEQYDFERAQGYKVEIWDCE